ncbi:hypothetical protein EXN66_Car007926 [Channa argus]|uniref:Uncharacterized protein n=1 Tax=Channa argus TaxID=215402 RepID=A0A6G1PPM0_CHAAH|nr:hypothetical protein EXN66_Car007926 [Channa argus]
MVNDWLKPVSFVNSALDFGLQCLLVKPPNEEKTFIYCTHKALLYVWHSYS